MYVLLQLLLLATAVWKGGEAQFNNPPGVDIWCGKAYRATNASFYPGGFFEEPATSSIPLLNLNISPRMTIYLASDTQASFLVGTDVSDQVGQPLGYAFDPTAANATQSLLVDIQVDGGPALVKSTKVALGSVDHELPFSLSGLAPRTEAYNITLKATLASANTTTYTASTQLYRLPSRNDTGTSARVDNLYGGLEYQTANSSSWQPIFAYTYYVQWTLYWYANLSTLDDFHARGYNVIHIVPTGDLGNTPFPWALLAPYLDRAAELGLLLHFDVRFEPGNLGVLTDVVTRLRAHPSMLLWYLADEPDGKSNPLDAMGLARAAIQALDPYHPVSLALNCYDFYYTDYAAGADIVLSDVYPVAINATFSTVYGTPCNATYGDCGCDDCAGEFEDIAARLEHFARVDSLVGWRKTHWGAPQAFGNETFWTRYPDAREEVVMTFMYVNHGAKGIVMWNYPVTADVLAVTDALADVLPAQSVADYLLGAPLEKGLTVDGADRVDAAGWVKEGGALVSVVNLNYGSVGEIRVSLPQGLRAVEIVNVFWGNATWTVEDGELVVASLPGLEVSLLEVLY